MINLGFSFWKRGAPVPTISSLNYPQGTIDGGGASIVITGSGFTGTTGASGVTFLGTNATSYTVNSDTQITATLPAHAAATGNVQVNAPGGSATHAFEYFSPAQLSANGWWKANYTAPGSDPRWTGSASAGTSGSHNLNLDGALPTTGTAQGGFTPAHFVAGSADSLASSTALSTLATAGAGTVVALANPGTLIAAGATGDLDPCIASDNTNRYWNLSITSSGSRFSLNDGAVHSTGFVSNSTGVWQAFISTWDGTHINHQVNGTAATQGNAGNITSTADTMLVGKTAGVGWSSFDLLELLIFPSVLSAGNITKMRLYFDQLYGVSV